MVWPDWLTVDVGIDVGREALERPQLLPDDALV